MSVGADFLTVICDRGLISEIRTVERGAFTEGDELEFYDLCSQHLRRYGTLPAEDTITERLEITLAPCEDTVEYYLQALRDRQLHNDIVGPFNDLRTALNNRETDNCKQSISQLSAVVRTRTSSADFLSVGEVGQMSEERYGVNHRIDGMVGVTTGFSTLDADCNGFQDGDFNVIVSRPGIGKTWILLHMIKAAVETGRNVLMITLEMSLQQIGTRLFSYAANVSPTHARTGKLGFYDQQRYLQAIARYREEYNRTFFIYGGGMGQGMGGVDAVIAERRPDIVYIDGVYLLKSPRTSRNAQPNQAVADVLDDLKELALQRNVPIMGTSQLSREGAGENVNLETIGFTDAFSRNCSIIYALQKPHRTAEDKTTRILKTLKGREGESAQMAINFKFRPIRFSETNISVTRRRGGAAQTGGQALGWMQNDNDNTDNSQ